MDKRKLFCEYGPVCYKIALIKESLKKNLNDFLSGKKFAEIKDKQNFEYIWKGHISLILRPLDGVDMKLQENKAVNLAIAGKKIDGIIIKPGEIFSFWKLIGNATKKMGYKEGLIISNGEKKSGIGGGLCQLANLIHYMVLHTPLEVTEIHHHSDALFPDAKRKVPFGIGTSVSYYSLDYRFKNITDREIQIRIWQDDTMLYGEIRAAVPLTKKYSLIEENCYYSLEEGVYYRNSEVYRIITDSMGEQSKELVLKNHSKVLYDYKFIPQNEIRV